MEATEKRWLSEGIIATTSGPSDGAPRDRMPGDTVRINVGGTLFETHRSTLSLAPPHSLLRRMFAPDGDARWAPPGDTDGAPFLDLDPQHFALFLNVLRHGADLLGVLGPVALHGVRRVADYLGMPIAGGPPPEGPVGRLVRELARVPIYRHARIAVATPASLHRNAFDLCDWFCCPCVSVLSTWTVDQVMVLVSDAAGIARRRLVVYLCKARPCQSVRPYRRLDPARDGAAPFAQFLAWRWKKRDAFLFVTDPSMVRTMSPPDTDGSVPDGPPETDRDREDKDPNGDIGDIGGDGGGGGEHDRSMLLFVRSYTRRGRSLGKCHAVLVDPGATVSSVLPQLCSAAEINASPPPAVPPRVLKERGRSPAHFIDRNKTFVGNALMCGDVLMVENDATAAASRRSPLALGFVRSGSDIDFDFVRKPSHMD